MRSENMRTPRLVLAAATTLICLSLSGLAGSGEAFATTVTITPHWRRVATGLEQSGEGDVIAASNQFLVLANAAQSSGELDTVDTLFNTSTDRTTVISPPGCSGGAADGTLGGPYLAVECTNQTLTAPVIVHLLNLSSGVWTERTLEPGTCNVDGIDCQLESVGTSWLRFSTPSPDPEHDPQVDHLQNLATGAVIKDFFPTGTDSLNNPSGTRHPCASVPAGLLDDDFLGSSDFQPGYGYFGQVGHFLLTSGTHLVDGDSFTSLPTLESCLDRTSLRIGLDSIASPDMVIWQQGSQGVRERYEGLLLPGLQPFQITSNKGPLAAVANHTIYETTAGPNTASGLPTYELWAAVLPRVPVRGPAG